MVYLSGLLHARLHYFPSNRKNKFQNDTAFTHLVQQALAKSSRRLSFNGTGIESTRQCPRGRVRALEGHLSLANKKYPTTQLHRLAQFCHPW